MRQCKHSVLLVALRKDMGRDRRQGKAFDLNILPRLTPANLYEGELLDYQPDGALSTSEPLNRRLLSSSDQSLRIRQRVRLLKPYRIASWPDQLLTCSGSLVVSGGLV